MPFLIGCIADDLTGATDLAMILTREGLKTIQVVGVPSALTPIPEADAIVIALKSRTLGNASSRGWIFDHTFGYGLRRHHT